MRKPIDDIRVFKDRRKSLAKLIPNSALILTAHPEHIRNNDVMHAYRQDSNLYYLTGFDEPESILVFRPGQSPETVMFVRDKDVTRETWEGFRFGPEGAKTEFGFDEVYSFSRFKEIAPELLDAVDKVYYRFFHTNGYDKLVEQALLDTKKRMYRSGRGLLPIEDSYQLLGEMRIIKSAHEVSLMKKAASLTSKAHIEVMKHTRPGVNERTLHGVFLKSMMEEGAAREAYGGIFASGNNATTLHYVFNDKECEEGELLLVDAGGEYKYYAADITRTFPVNGRFNEAQKRMYGNLLALQKSLIEAVKPGMSFHVLQKQAFAGLTQIMVDEGLLSGNVQQLINDQAAFKFYPHGVGHWLGMDVHDAGLAKVGGEPRPFTKGMVFTVEPGIYIPQSCEEAPDHLRGMGIRIEDNVLVTEKGCEVLTYEAPKEILEIESTVGSL